jgi:hypothetical protein
VELRRLAKPGTRVESRPRLWAPTAQDAPRIPSATVPKRLSRTNGVLPINLVTSLAIFMCHLRETLSCNSTSTVWKPPSAQRLHPACGHCGTNGGRRHRPDGIAMSTSLWAAYFNRGTRVVAHRVVEHDVLYALSLIADAASQGAFAACRTLSGQMGVRVIRGAAPVRYSTVATVAGLKVNSVGDPAVEDPHVRSNVLPIRPVVHASIRASPQLYPREASSLCQYR